MINHTVFSRPIMIKDEWVHYPNSRGSDSYTRWINQFIDFSKMKSRDDLLNNFDSNEQIEQMVFDWIQYLKPQNTEDTINQKVSALILFYEIHKIPFLSNRIIESFPNHPIYHDKFTIDLIKK